MHVQFSPMPSRPRPSFGLYILMGATLPLVPVRADYLDEIGYRALATEIGAGLPDGAAIRIDQIEAPTGGGAADPVYRADPNDPAFLGVIFHDQTAGTNPAFSGHATDVARIFAGNASMTPGVLDVDSYEANDWLGKILYNGGSGLQRPVTGTGVLANHSWVGATSTVPQSVDVLQRLDWLIETSDYVQVVGVNTAANALFSNAYNVIGVTYSGNVTNSVTSALDTFYAAGRALPHLTVPLGSPSAATAAVTAAVALLIDAAPGDSLKPETVKALLMAGANRVTRNGSPNLLPYTPGTANGLDPRYGAGQLDIRQSYQLLAGGERASQEDGGGSAGLQGYDYDAGFGGANATNSVATYPLGTVALGGRLQATVVWHAFVEDTGGAFAPTQRVVRNLNLQLTDTTAGGTAVVAQSSSTVDDTETINAELLAGRTYTLRVTSANPTVFNQDYAVAWRLEVDRDRDGLFDKFETGACPLVSDADSDDDGLRDGAEDANFDGVISGTETNPCNADSDGDGLQDGTELGIVNPVPAENGNAGTAVQTFIPDADPATRTLATVADSDGDGVSDGAEDFNHNGARDPGESDPNDASSLPQTPTRVPFAPVSALIVLGCWMLRTARRRLQSPA